MVAGVDLDLVAGEVAEAGDDRGFLGVNHDHRLFALKGLITFGVVRAVWGAQCSGEEGPRLVGHAGNGASLPYAPKQEKRHHADTFNMLHVKLGGYSDQKSHFISKTSLWR